MYVLNVSPRLQDGKWDICILAPAGFDKASCHVEEDSTAVEYILFKVSNTIKTTF